MENQILSIVLTGQFKSGGEAMLVGLLGGGMLYLISYIIRRLKGKHKK